jgi:flagellar biosynthesis protein FliP
MVKKFGLLIFVLFGAMVVAEAARAQVTLPQVNLGFKSVDEPKDLVSSLKILLMLTVLTLAPAILILMTSFTRIIIVLSFVRMALGTQNMPPNQMLVGLAMFMTLFIMSPFLNRINNESIQPYLNNQIKQEEAIEKAVGPLRLFMFNQTRDQDLGLFVNLSKMEKPKTRADVPTYVLIPAFIVSELKTSFQIGFVIYLPFLVIDMIAASVLMAMGMMMLPPVIISLPFKIMLFVLVDGWTLIVGSLVKSFG